MSQTLASISAALSLIVALFTSMHVMAADNAALTVRINNPIASAYYPVTVPGKMLPMLHGIQTARITLYAMHASGAKLIPFQIDRREGTGQYRIEPELDDDRPDRAFTAEDEMVFMAADIGSATLVATIPLRTIAVLNIGDEKSFGTVYVAVANDGPAPRSAIDYVHYNADQDSITADDFRIQFNTEKPFLVSSLQWQRSDGFSSNLIDTMKVRHRGKMFGSFDFLRTEADYDSKLEAVKDGAIRVIRRTYNRVRVFWSLRSPGVDIDYIVYANHVVMDMTLDFPFKIGWFFSDVTTTASMDLAGTPGVRIYDSSAHNWLNIDGHMTAAKQHYNEADLKRFYISHADGMIFGTMHLTERMPIAWRGFLVDDVTRVDPPELIAGQFGNIGFYTSNWEAMDTDVYHLYYSFYFITTVPIEQAQAILDGAPRYGQDRR